MKNLRKILLGVAIVSTCMAQPPIPHEDFFDYYNNPGSYKEALSLSQLLSNAISSFKEALSSVPDKVTAWFTKPQPLEKPILVRHAPHDELNEQEIQFLSQRKNIVLKGCASLFPSFNPNRHTLPTIAVCCSGGGFRSMITSLGFMQGLYETGLLDCISYISTLSGSTWFLAPWIVSQSSLHEYQKILGRTIRNGIRPLKANQHTLFLTHLIFNRIMHHNCLSAIDLYGGLLANTLLDFIPEKKLSLTFHQAHQSLNPTQHPFPIYTAICGNILPYPWFEITPFEVGSSYGQAYIPSEAYGHTFIDGKALNSASHFKLAHFLGMWGSTFALSLKDILHHTADKLVQTVPPTLKHLLNTCLTITLGSSWREARLLPGLIPNFTYQVPCNPLGHLSHLMLIDAGIDFNLPLPPLLRSARNIDLILIYDASSSPCTELYRAQAYAQRCQLPFPIITDTNPNNPILICNSTKPIILYFPCVKNDQYALSFDPQCCIKSGYCGTLNFNYTPAQIEELCGLARFTVHHYADIIKAVIYNCMTFA